MSTISNPAELRRRGLETLIRELGHLDAMRFLLQYDTGRGDYTQERHQLLPTWTVEELLREADKLISPSPRSDNSDHGAGR